VRIAVDARQLVPPITGIGRYTENLLQQLLSSGDEWFLYSDRPLAEELRHWADLPGVTVREGNARGRGLRSLWIANIDFARWANRDRIDVFWSPRHHLPLALKKHIVGVVSIHDLVWRRYPETMPQANLWVERLAMAWSLRRAQQVIAVSGFTRSEIGHFYPSAAARTSVVHEAARSLGAPAAPRLEQPYFLFVGTLEPRKNLLRLLEAYGGFAANSDCSHRLVIIGAAGWGLPSLQDKCRQLGIESRVHFPGFVSDGELAGYYRGATALVLPSLYEGFGLPVVEAMEQGTPAIVSDRGSLPEVAGNAALLVNPESTASVQAALMQMATDSEKRAELAQRCLVQKDHYSWEKAAATTLELLRRAVRD